MLSKLCEYFQIRFIVCQRVNNSLFGTCGCGFTAGSCLFVIVVFLLVYGGAAQAQTILGDAKGRSTLMLFNEELPSFGTQKNLNISYNSAENGLKSAYILEPPDSPFKVKLELGGKAVNGLRSLLDDDARSTELFVNSAIGYMCKTDREENPDPIVTNQLFMVEFGYCRETYTLLDQVPELPDTEKTDQKEQMVPSIDFYYNVLLENRLLAGLSVGYTRQNNYVGLSRRSVVTSKPLTEADSTASAVETQVIVHQLTAREGDYKEFEVFRAKAEVFHILRLSEDTSETAEQNGYKFALNLFLNYTYRAGGDDLFEPGIGIFKLAERSPNRQMAAESTNSETAEGEANTNAGNSETPEASNQDDGRVRAAIPYSVETQIAPWKIVYGVIGQWDAELETFRYGVVGGINF